MLFSERAPLAYRALLIGIAAAGERLVAVGERGHVLLSDDRGRTWAQADSVPTQALLTGVCFIDARRGIVVGHDEVILTTQDAGRTWKRTHYAPQAQQPLLDVACNPRGRAIAVGAYSAYLVSEDGGANHHLQGDCRKWLDGKPRLVSTLNPEPWDLIIAHPPCTYLCNSGVRWLAPGGKLYKPRHDLMQEACDLFAALYHAPIPHVCIENPVMHKYAKDYLQSAWKVPRY